MPNSAFTDKTQWSNPTWNPDSWAAGPSPDKENKQNICNIREAIYPSSGGLAEQLLKKVEKAGCGKHAACNDMSIHDDDDDWFAIS